MKPTLLSLSLLLLSTTAFSQEQNPESLQPVIIPGTESFTIKSKAVGQDYMATML